MTSTSNPQLEVAQELRQRSPKQELGNIPSGPRACLGCRRSNLELLSELDDLRCRNCRINLELADCPTPTVCPESTQTEAIDHAGQLPSNFDPNPSTVHDPGFSFNLSISTFIVQARHVFQEVVSISAQLLFFCLPSYYAFDASSVLKLADQYRSDCERWLDSRSVHATSMATPTATDITSDATDIYGSAPPHPAAAPSSVDQQDSLPPCIFNFQKAWKDYIDAHLGEWKILLTVAGILLGASLANFPILGMRDDPLTRSFLYFAVYRAFSSILFNLAFVLQFARSYTRGPMYAAVWAQEARKPDTAVWRMLAVPGVATFWALISYFAAISTMAWRDNPPHPSPDTGPMILVCRILVTGIGILVDVGGALWVWTYMKWIGRTAEGKDQRDAGSDAERGP